MSATTTPTRNRRDATLRAAKDPESLSRVEAGCWFDAAAGDYVVRFFETFLTHSKAPFAGQPFLLQPWQKDLIRTIYGWKNEDGTRTVREVYEEIAKKNGKTTKISGASLYHLVADGEAGAEVYPAAVDRDQAGRIYSEALAMVRASKPLSRVLDCSKEYKKRIDHPSSGSFLQALSADAKKHEGLNASFVPIDELHAHITRILFDTLRYAGAARSQPLLWSISTAGFDRQSLCYQVRTYAEKVASGMVKDPAFHAAIFAAADGDDYEDPRVWRKANPSMGVTLREEDFRRELQAAKDTPGALLTFLRYRLNIWTQAESAWIDPPRWEACGKAPIIPEDWNGCETNTGLDLSSTRDLTSFNELIGEPSAGAVTIPHFWLPEETAAERQRRDRVPYLDWARQGYLKLTRGDSVDYDTVVSDILGINKLRPIRRLYCDPWNATETARKLRDAGINVEFMRQGFASVNAPMKELERSILRRTLHHGGHPVLTWCAANVVCETDAAGNIKPAKDKAREKIDGISALINAFASAMDAPSEGTGPSVYETRGVPQL